MAENIFVAVMIVVVVAVGAFAWWIDNSGKKKKD